MPAEAAAALPGAHSSLMPLLMRRETEIGEDYDALVMAVLDAQRLQMLAEEALRRQTEALALAVHELRNPLMPIRTVAAMLAKSIEIRDPGQLGVVLERQVAHMVRLIDDLMDASRAATGKLHVRWAQVDLAQVFAHVVDICQPAMDGRTQRFTAYVPGGPNIVDGDGVRLTQVFANLLQNASKYTPRGGAIVLTFTVEAIDKRTRVAVIKIADNGIGITPEALPMIFEPFVQDPHAIGFANDGLGVGLTLVRELVQAHGGTVSATSPGAGLGSEFVVRLPMTRINTD